MDIGIVFLAVVGLPEKNWGEILETILFAAFFGIFFISCAVTIIRSYIRNRFCPCCGAKTKIDWRTDKSDPDRGRITIARKRITLRFGRGTAIHAVPVARCPKCGFEIDLGK